MNRATLIVSLDFELNWGYRDNKRPLNFAVAKQTLDQLKSLFDELQIHTSWATVGGLFDQSSQTESEQEDSLLYQKKWINQNLKNDPKVDLGSHTYSHLFMMESSMDQVLGDFQQMEKLKTTDLQFETLVFPRNQYNPAILSLASNFGIKYYRSVNDKWYLQSSKFSRESKLRQLLKRAFELIPLTRFVEVNDKYGIIGVSDSRFFRFFPNTSIGKLLARLYYPILKLELKRAIKQGRAYHIWFHPHNLMTNPHGIQKLEDFLRYYKSLQQEWGGQSMNIKEYVDSFS